MDIQDKLERLTYLAHAASSAHSRARAQQSERLEYERDRLARELVDEVNSMRDELHELGRLAGAAELFVRVRQ